MELSAVIEALKVIPEPCNIKIYSDSQYVTKGISEWLSGWIKKNFKGVKNPELWQEYIKVSEGFQIMTEWVKGHSGHPENERCDRLANLEAAKF